MVGGRHNASPSENHLSPPILGGNVKASGLKVKVSVVGTWLAEKRLNRLTRKANQLATALERAAAAMEKLNDER